MSKQLQPFLKSIKKVYSQRRKPTCPKAIYKPVGHVLIELVKT